MLRYTFLFRRTSEPRLSDLIRSIVAGSSCRAPKRFSGIRTSTQRLVVVCFSSLQRAFSGTSPRTRSSGSAARAACAPV